MRLTRGENKDNEKGTKRREQSTEAIVERLKPFFKGASGVITITGRCWFSGVGWISFLSVYLFSYFLLHKLDQTIANRDGDVHMFHLLLLLFLGMNISFQFLGMPLIGIAKDHMTGSLHEEESRLR